MFTVNPKPYTLHPTRRILLKPVDALRATDIADHALAALAQSTISRAHIIGRRGPAQVSLALHPAPCTLHPTPYSLNPKHPKLYAVNPTP